MMAAGRNRDERWSDAGRGISDTTVLDGHGAVRAGRAMSGGAISRTIASAALPDDLQALLAWWSELTPGGGAFALDDRGYGPLLAGLRGRRGTIVQLPDNPRDALLDHRFLYATDGYDGCPFRSLATRCFGDLPDRGSAEQMAATHLDVVDAARPVAQYMRVFLYGAWRDYCKLMLPLARGGRIDRILTVSRNVLPGQAEPGAPYRPAP